MITHRIEIGLDHDSNRWIVLCSTIEGLHLEGVSPGDLLAKIGEVADDLISANQGDQQ